jgi:hypothetical protein
MKNRKSLLLVIPAMAIISLAGCGNNSSSEPLSLFSDKTKFIGTIKVDPDKPTVLPPETFANMRIAPLATYHLSNKGDVPYVELDQLVSTLSVCLDGTVTKGMSGSLKDDGYHIYSANKKGEVILNAENDTVKVKDSVNFCDPILFTNNSIAGDYCSFRNNTIRESEKTKVYKEDGSKIEEYVTYSFKYYGFDIYKKDNKYYAPFEAVTKILYTSIGIDMAFNGSEYYITQLGSFTSSLVKSSKGYWSAYSGIYAPVKAGEGEAYRFSFSFNRLKEDGSGDKETVTKFISLYNNEQKTGSCILCPGTEYDSTKALPDKESSFLYVWRQEGQIIYISVSDENSNLLGEYGIHLDETRFIKNTISKEMSEYNYNILRFMFDNIYGLKDIKKYDSAESYFTSCGVKEDLKSTDVKKYNAAFAKLIGKVDDGHTGFNGLSIYTAYDDLDALPTLTKANIGPRLAELMNKKNKYAKARIDKYAELNPGQGGNPDPNFYQGIKFSDNNETAIITFDAFTYESTVLENMKERFPNDEEIETYRVRSDMISSSANGFSAAFQLLKHMNKTSKVVKNVVIDLTNNGGGAIALLPYLTAFFSDDPAYVIKDTTTGAIKEYHYKVDLNGDGVFGGTGDTFKNDFNFYCLTSGFSFSCGNCLPGIAKDNGVKIIGEQSGGGVSPVGVYYDALGSQFNISNHYQMLYKDSNGKYIQNDSGITLDHAFPFDNGNWYDPNAVNTFVKSLVK